MSQTGRNWRRPMGEVVRGLPTKSAKIRALHAEGYERTEIRDYLGISYQHVRNVLVAPRPKASAHGPSRGKTLSDDQRAAMEQLCEKLPTKSAKIRALHRAGYSRGDIARFLGILYQHVRNVLLEPLPKGEWTPRGNPSAENGHDRKRVASEPLGSTSRAGELASSSNTVPSSVSVPSRTAVWAKLGPTGELTIPDALLGAMGVEPGDDVVLRCEDEELHVSGRDAAIRRAQRIVRRHVPEGVSLVDELIADRRAEAAREDRGR